jgi:hypothetical protein
MEGRATEGDSPVGAGALGRRKTLSTAGHEQAGGKQRGPPCKAKDVPSTDSAPVPRGKGEKDPERGVKETLKPRAYKPWEPHAGPEGRAG